MNELFDGVGGYKPCYLFANGAPLFPAEAAESLHDRLGTFVDVETVLGEFPRYTWHVGRLPCEDIPILMEELNELVFLFVLQAGTNGSFLGAIGHCLLY